MLLGKLPPLLRGIALKREASGAGLDGYAARRATNGRPLRYIGRISGKSLAMVGRYGHRPLQGILLHQFISQAEDLRGDALSLPFQDPAIQGVGQGQQHHAGQTGHDPHRQGKPPQECPKF